MSAALGVALAVATVVRAAASEPFGVRAARIALAPGVIAERSSAACSGWSIYGRSCVAWRVTGAMVPPQILLRANMFAAAPGGRIVAALPDGVSYTDDRGASWRAARWESSGSPLTLAFDATSGFGVAVGLSGCVWTTDDRGETWRSRRDDPGSRLIDVAVVGTVIVMADDRGGLWVSTDRGISVRTLADPSVANPSTTLATITMRGRTIWALARGTTWWRIDENGSIERAEGGPAP